MFVGIRKTGDMIDGDAMEDIGWPTVRQQEESSCPLIRVYVNVVNCYVMNTISAAGQSDSHLQGLFSSFRADTPWLELVIDRAQAKDRGVSIDDIRTTLESTLGPFYINDFNYLGRTYKVIAHADAPFRAKSSDVAQLKTRNGSGEMVPLGTVMELKDIVDADRINRYNLYPSAEINGAGAAGVSSGQAIEIMANLAKKVLPAGMGFEWTELAYQEETDHTPARLAMASSSSR